MVRGEKMDNSNNNSESWSNNLFMNLPTDTPQDAQERPKQDEEERQRIIDRFNAGTAPQGKNQGKIKAPAKRPTLSPEERLLKSAQEKAAEKAASKPKVKKRIPLGWTNEEEKQEMYKKIRLQNVRATQTPIRFYLSNSKDSDIIKYLNSQPNKTDYIRQLIIADMRKKEAAPKK